MSERIDKLLVSRRLAISRSQARLLIDDGLVYGNGKQITKSGQLFDQEVVLEVKREREYVGRGALKIEHALKCFEVDVRGMIVADVGASTGGFSDCLLQQGAQKIYAIDVGHGQLAAKLLQDDRVINLEGINIRHQYQLPEKVNLCVVDLSYISLKLVLNNIAALLDEQGRIIALIKPQFEAGVERIGKNGLIKDNEVRIKILEEIYDWCQENSLGVLDVIRSPICGKTGNIEYFFFLRPNSQRRFGRERLKDL